MDDMIEINLKLTPRQAGYLNCAVVDFFHKMKVAADVDFVIPNFDEKFIDARQIWRLVEEQTKTGEWE